jgi:hypothetical protein
MKIGSDNPKQVAAAGILMCVAGYTMYTQVIAPADEPVYSRPVPAQQVPASLIQAPQTASRGGEASRNSTDKQGTEQRPGRTKSASFGEWVPTLKPKRPEDRLNTAQVNPALRTDLLAKVQSVEAAGGGRNLFEFGLAPKPIEDPKIALTKKGGSKNGGGASAGDPPKPADSAKAEPVKPPPPPIPLKYYGYVAGSGNRQAFFLNGEEIFAVSEGQTIQTRYRVIRIGDVNAVVEDLQHKHQQTIKLEEPPNT